MRAGQKKSEKRSLRLRQAPMCVCPSGNHILPFTGESRARSAERQRAAKLPLALESPARWGTCKVRGKAWRKRLTRRPRKRFERLTHFRVSDAGGQTFVLFLFTLAVLPVEGGKNASRVVAHLSIPGHQASGTSERGQGRCPCLHLSNVARALPGAWCQGKASAGRGLPKLARRHVAQCFFSLRAFCSMTSSTPLSPLALSEFSARMVDAARGTLNDFLPDVWVYTDHCKASHLLGSKQSAPVNSKAIRGRPVVCWLWSLQWQKLSPAKTSPWWRKTLPRVPVL